MQTGIDHLVIGAANLSQGISYIKESLGVDIPYGGVHEKMGTHNHLMQLGNNIFLEVIAIHPDIEAPESPRWYGLDDPYVRQQIEVQPSLLTWVVNTTNIDALVLHAGFSFGKPKLISRGDLKWYFGLPDDGRLLAGGLLPYVIDWQTSSHPSDRMADLGCRLKGLEIFHPYPFWIQSILESVGAANLVKINALPKDSAPYLKTYIDTSKGVKALHSATGRLK